MTEYNPGDPLPKIYCHVCGKEVTINADRGKHILDSTLGPLKRYRFFCATCANACYQAALDRGHVLHGWVFAPRWFAQACLTLERRAQRGG